MAARARHTGRWTLEDRFASLWHYLPVEVPPGTCALRARLRYDRSAGVLDLGCFGPGGFRGWSGGAREEFTVAADAATPGYLPGEIEPGAWQVVIGLYRLPADGLPFALEVETSAARGRIAPPPPRPAPPALADGERPPARRLPGSGGRQWRAGDLHTHTVHSDGALTVPELARLAASQGLDFLAVTDHNTVSHHAELASASARYGITLLPGQEVTRPAGHAGVIGAPGAAAWIDFREPADAWLEAAERSGALMSVNHPIGGEVSWALPMRRRPPLAEIWHWSWLDRRWTTPLGWWLAWSPEAIPVGGSDWHRAGSDALPGVPTTWALCDGDDPRCVLDALAAGRVAVSASRDGPVLLRAGDEILAVGADGTVLAGPDGPCARVRGDRAVFPGRPGRHRLLDASGATLALIP